MQFFWKRAIFPKFKINHEKLQNKTLFVFYLNPQYFFILGKSFYSLSHIFVIEIIDDKLNKIKWSYSQNLRELKYENNEIPNSLRGSWSCVEFLGSTKMQNKIWYAWWSNVYQSKLKIWDVTWGVHHIPPWPSSCPKGGRSHHESAHHHRWDLAPNEKTR